MAINKRFVQWSALVLLIFIVIFTRAPEVLLLPSLQADDGIHVFEYFYENRGPEHILRFKAGYIPMVANIVGYLSVRLPTRLIPYGMAWLPLVITLAAYSLLFSARYRSWLESDLSRAVTCLLFALAPLSQFLLLEHTDYSIWNTLLLLILMSVTPLPRSKWEYPWWVLTNVLVWSHPLTILVVPFQGYLLFRDKPNRILYALTILNLLLHMVFGVEHAQALGGPSFLAALGSLAKAALWSVYIAAQTAFRAAFGPQLFNWANQQMPLLFPCWGLAVAGLTLLVFIRSPRTRLPLIALFYSILGLTFASIVGRGYAETTDLNGGIRYTYIQHLAFLALFVFLIYRLPASFRVSTVPAVEGKTTSRGRRWSIIVFTVLIGYYAAMNIGARGAYQYAHPENGKIVREFFQTLEEAEKRDDIEEGSYLTAERINDWPLSVKLSKRK